MMSFLALAQQCAPTVAPQTMAAIAQVESTFEPYAIGVVGGRLEWQPKNIKEAVATATALHEKGWNFSVGVVQINRYNLPKNGLTYEQAFNPCENLRVGSKILEDCYTRALPNSKGDKQHALKAAFSCYYSGNFSGGFLSDKVGEPSYVEKVLAQASVTAKPIPVISNIKNSVSQTQSTNETVKAVPVVPNIGKDLSLKDYAPVLSKGGNKLKQSRQNQMDKSAPVNLSIINDDAKGDGDRENSTIVF